jgi:hypothetical protein
MRKDGDGPIKSVFWVAPAQGVPKKTMMEHLRNIEGRMQWWGRAIRGGLRNGSLEWWEAVEISHTLPLLVIQVDGPYDVPRTPTTDELVIAALATVLN